VGIVGWSHHRDARDRRARPRRRVPALIPSVTACVEELQAAGVKMIIGLGHSGINFKAPLGGGAVPNDADVAAQVPGPCCCALRPAPYPTP